MITATRCASRNNRYHKWRQDGSYVHILLPSHGFIIQIMLEIIKVDLLNSNVFYNMALSDLASGADR